MNGRSGLREKGVVVSALDIIGALERADNVAVAAKRARTLSADEGVDRDDSSEERATSVADMFRVEPVAVTDASMFDHYARLRFVLDYCDRFEGSRWMGIQRFLDLYFSTVYGAYMGDGLRCNVVHVRKDRSLGARFVLHEDASYTVIVLLNYRFWDKLLSTAASLPSVYFREPRRDYAYAGRSLEAEVALFPDSAASDSFDSRAGKGAARDVCAAALALVHRLELYLQDDLRCARCDHVVTLAKFFTARPDAPHPLVVRHRYD